MTQAAVDLAHVARHHEQQRPGRDQWTSTDAADLMRFFNQLEAACGVRSTMEGQIATLNRRSISDGAKLEATREKRERSRQRKQPPPSAPTMFEQARDALLDHLGIEPVLEPGEPTPQERRDLEPWAQLIHVKESSSGPVVDPYADDMVLRVIREAAPIRARLRSISERSRNVLHAAYGPMRGDTDRNNGLRKKFGDALIEIVVGIIWMAHDDLSIAGAREMAFWKSKDPSFVTMQKKQAEKILDAAHVEYGAAKVATWT